LSTKAKMSGVKLSLSAVRQILTGQGLKPPEEEELIKKIEETARKFDGSGRGELSDREAFNVLKMQHKVNISQDKVNLQNKVLSIVIWKEQF